MRSTTIVNFINYQSLRETEASTFAKLVTANGNGTEERWLSVDEAVEKYALSRRWLYDNADKLPFAKRVSKKKLAIKESGLVRWLEHRP